MNTHVNLEHGKFAHAKDDFLVRFQKNLVKEIVTAGKIAKTIFGIFFAITLGIILFVSEFDLTKKFFACAFIPVVILLIGTYLTLLPMYLVIAVTLMALYSLASADEGAKLAGWFDGMVDSIFEGPGSTSKDVPLSKKLLGFMALSAVASFFIVFLV